MRTARTPRRRPIAGPPRAARPHSEKELTGTQRHGLLRNVTDTDVRLWRRVHMDLVRYAGCVCRPSC
ncbi:putative leader peptide [Streptomyces sp. NPDC050395]|uniref:putative leader peptide n=1 Tax=Streptomyces sp. NPDC050395 TaxID=3155401 RepID=UPI0034210AD7